MIRLWRRVIDHGSIVSLVGMLLTVPAFGQAIPYVPPPVQKWSFLGPFGQFDMTAVQRGYAVYDAVCSSCHSMQALTYLDLMGTGLNLKQVQQIAQAHKVPSGHGEGPATRTATAVDSLPVPFATPAEGRAANNGVAPPDASRMAVVYPGGPDRIFALLTGYSVAPAGFHLRKSAFYNPYALGRQIVMPAPLRDNQVVYTDGTVASAEQEARDVTTFLAWAAQPHLGERHQMGVRVVCYLLILLVLTILLKRKVWSNVR